MKALSVTSMAIVATYIMSTMAHAADQKPANPPTPPPFESEADKAKTKTDGKTKTAGKADEKTATGDKPFVQPRAKAGVAKAADAKKAKTAGQGHAGPAANGKKAAFETSESGGTPQAQAAPTQATQPAATDKPADQKTAEANVTEPKTENSKTPETQTTVNKPAETKAPDGKPGESGPSLPITAPKALPTTVKQKPAEKLDVTSAHARHLAFNKRYEDLKGKKKLTAADRALAKWMTAQQKRYQGPHLPYDNEQFRAEFAFRLSLYDWRTARLEAGEAFDIDEDDNEIEVAGQVPTPPVGGGDLEQEREALRAAEEKYKEAEARYQQCTADCAKVKSELEKVREENSRILAQAQEDKRRADQAQADADAARRGRRSTYNDRDGDGYDDDGDSEFGRGGRGRSGSRYGRDPYGRTYGRNGNGYGYPNGNGYPYNGYANPAMNPNGFYNDPFSLGNPNMFGVNGMQNPYPYWMNQQMNAGRMFGNQMYYNPNGLNGGRMLPAVYPAPGGGMQQPWMMGNRMGAPMYAGQPFMGGRPVGGAPYMNAPFTGGAPMYAGSPFMGGRQGGPVPYMNAPYSGGAPMYAGGVMGGGVRQGAPAYAPYGGGGYPSVGYGTIGAPGSAAPAFAPYIGGSGFNTGYGYNGYGLGANCGGWSTPVRRW